MACQRIALLGDLHYFTPEFSRENNLSQELIDHFYHQYFSMVRNELQTNAAICVGDVTHRGEKHEFRNIYGLLSKADLMLSHVMGNHDVLTHAIADLGPLKFHKHNEVCENNIGTFVFLDTPYEQNKDKNWGGDLTEAQIQLITELRSQVVPSPLVVVSHHPIYDTTEGSTGKLMSIPEERDLTKLVCPSNQISVFINGHVHATDYCKKNGWHYFQIPSVFASKHLFVLEAENDTYRVCAKPIKDDIWLDTAVRYGKALIGHTFVADHLEPTVHEFVIS